MLDGFPVWLAACMRCNVVEAYQLEEQLDLGLQGPCVCIECDLRHVWQSRPNVRGLPMEGARLQPELNLLAQARLTQAYGVHMQALTTF